MSVLRFHSKASTEEEKKTISNQTRTKEVFQQELDTHLGVVDHALLKRKVQGCALTGRCIGVWAPFSRSLPIIADTFAI